MRGRCLPNPEGFERMETAALVARKLIMPRPEPEPHQLRRSRELPAVIVMAIMPAAAIAIATVARPFIYDAAGKGSGQNRAAQNRPQGAHELSAGSHRRPIHE